MNRIDKEMEMRGRVETMNSGDAEVSPTGRPMILVVSDSTGEMAKQLISRILVQFEGTVQERDPVVKIYSYVTGPMQLAEVLSEVQATEGKPFIFASLVQPSMIKWLAKLCTEMSFKYVNVMESLLPQLAKFLGGEARGVPGKVNLSRRDLENIVSNEFSGMIEAAQFLRTHEDGQRSEDWGEADVILVGPSRVGKMGLASLLAQRGKKVATMSFDEGTPVPRELDGSTPVVAVKRDVDMISLRREARLRELERKNLAGVVPADYANVATIKRQVDYMDALVQQHPEWLSALDMSYLCDSEASFTVTSWLKTGRASVVEGAANGQAWDPSMAALFLVPAAAAIAGFVLTHARRPGVATRGPALASSTPRAGRAGAAALVAGPPDAIRCVANNAAANGGAGGSGQLRTTVAATLASAFGTGIEDDSTQKIIFVVSDSTGETAKLLIQRLLVQFQDLGQPIVHYFGYISTTEKITDVLAQAEALGSLSRILVFATLVDQELAKHLSLTAHKAGLTVMDVMPRFLRPVGEWLGGTARGVALDTLSSGPVETVSKVNTEFFRVVEAVQFAQQHMEGINSHEWPQADMVVVSLSRAGKEVLCSYLAQRGFRAASCSLTPNEGVPQELLDLDPRKVVVLHVEKNALAKRRRNRINTMKNSGLPLFLEATYANDEYIEFEVEYLQDLVRRNPKWHGPIDVTDLAVDECASIVRRLMADG